MARSILEQIQDDIYARLSSMEYFADIPIFILREQHIDDMVNKALTTLTKKANKTGAAVTILMPLCDAPNPNVPGPELDVITTIRTQELPLVNMGASGTKKSAEDIGITALRGLHRFRIAEVGTLYADKEALTPSREFLPKITYDAPVRVRVPLSALSKAITPIITEVALTVTLTNQTPGATIYYTTDATGTTPVLPWSGAVGVQLYGAPFVVTAGTVIRWAAYKAGMVGSDVDQVTIN